MRWAAVLVLAGALAACSGGGGGGGSATRSTATVKRAAPEPAPRLESQHRCRSVEGFTCSTLRVPLDHSGRAPGELSLNVAAADNAGAPRGVLLALTGGPGQGGVAYVPRVRTVTRSVLRDYRLVMIDQRGTGAHALRCPALQSAVGTSDLTVPPPGSVESCARRLGPGRRYYSTQDTVADLEALRRALGAPKLTIEGVSYGTYVAGRYAIAYPSHVDRLVLDSVVPAGGLDGLEVDGMRETARVLRLVCRAERCPGDPARDLAAAVARRRDGPALYDTLVALSVGAPSFPGVLPALRAASGGHPARLDRIVRAVRRAQRAPAGVLSQGLHAATVCADLHTPWGGPATPAAGREAALSRAAARAGDPAPFDRATVIGNGLIQTCLRWAPTPAPPPSPGGDLPAIPTLLLAGDRDLSTPLAWARDQAAHTPRGRLVIVRGSGHSVQSRGPRGAGRRAVREFLLG
jgi:pimeloyl-ACP methyl ester carboxylesterase